MDPSLWRPSRELVAFQKVFLEPGESREVVLGIAPERLAYYHDEFQQWVIESGKYELEIGASVTDIKAILPVEMTVGTKPRTLFTLDSVIGEMTRDPRGLAVMEFMMSQQAGTPVTMAEGDPFFTAILKNLPFKRIMNFSRGAVTEQQLLGLLMMINSNMTAEQVTATLNQYAPPPAEEEN